MDMTQIDEQWIEVEKNNPRPNTIVAISNTGKYRRNNGEVGVLSLRQRGTGKGDRKTAKRCYHIIAENFLITVRRSDQNQIDHITHNPVEYSINDVRNLRWCNHKENHQFEEFREKNSNAMKGRFVGRYRGSKHPQWKGDNVGPSGLYHRAKMLYESGEISEEEFRPYRKMIHQYNKEKEAKRATSSTP